ncbi:MAG: 2Fe-2S iron-sulfur cluster-binding protein [Caulobacteraceae bacterium]
MPHRHPATALIRYIEHAGTEHAIRIRVGQSIMAGAVQNGVPGIDGECGGGCKCATCHVYVDPAWLPSVGSPSGLEQGMLDCTSACRDNSRLSCQIIVTEALDGMTVRMPSSQH